jgi:hypothetical protein
MKIQNYLQMAMREAMNNVSVNGAKVEEVDERARDFIRFFE